MQLLVVLCIAAGGLVGAPARFVLDRFVADHVEVDFPLGTFVVNLSGSLLLGLLAGFDLAGHLPLLIKVGVGTGFCGAYTTFSTWTFETVRLLEEGEVLEALGNALLSLLGGLLAAGAGMALGSLH